MYSKSLFALAAIVPSALACLGYEGGVPAPTRTEHLSEPIYVRSGEVFDGQWAVYDRNPSTCGDQSEGGEDDTAFVLEAGATLRNAIIGRNTGEGVYCVGGGCSFEFVWFEDVCEDAISIKDDPAGSETHIIGGGAYHASDKIIQHNGCGHVNIINFFAEDYGKVYRSCGGCDECNRSVYVEGVTASNGGEVVGINLGDSATLNNVCSDHVPHCQLYDGPGDKVDGQCG